jgi:hypothetical protein
MWCGLDQAVDEVEQSVKRVFLGPVQERQQEDSFLVRYGRLYSLSVLRERLEIDEAVVPCWLGWKGSQAASWRTSARTVSLNCWKPLVSPGLGEFVDVVLNIEANAQAAEVVEVVDQNIEEGTMASAAAVAAPRIPRSRGHVFAVDHHHGAAVGVLDPPSWQGLRHLVVPNRKSKRLPIWECRGVYASRRLVEPVSRWRAA